jgi:hypothetical protein
VADTKEQEVQSSTEAIGAPPAHVELSDDMTPFEAATYFFHRAADRLELRDEMREVLGSTYRELSVQVPLRTDDGKVVVYRGYRIQHNGARGPYKGGIRYHESADLDEVRALAARNLDPMLPVMRAHGVPGLLASLSGDLSLQGAIAKGQADTRAYAKRQFTWFRNQMPDWAWVAPEAAFGWVVERVGK